MKPQSFSKIKKLEEEARQRILDRGKVEFRIEPELLSLILDLAKARKVAVGPMIRQWVKERLDQEVAMPKKGKSQLDMIEQKIDQLLLRDSHAESA